MNIDKGKFKDIDFDILSFVDEEELSIDEHNLMIEVTLKIMNIIDEKEYAIEIEIDNNKYVVTSYKIHNINDIWIQENLCWRNIKMFENEENDNFSDSGDCEDGKDVNGEDVNGEDGEDGEDSDNDN